MLWLEIETEGSHQHVVFTVRGTRIHELIQVTDIDIGKITKLPIHAQKQAVLVYATPHTPFGLVQVDKKFVIDNPLQLRMPLARRGRPDHLPQTVADILKVFTAALLKTCATGESDVGHLIKLVLKLLPQAIFNEGNYCMHLSQIGRFVFQLCWKDRWTHLLTFC